MATKQKPIIIESGYAYTKTYIANLKCQDNSSYVLGYINYDTPQQQTCAVKINDLNQEETRSTAQREKDVLMRVSHKNIAQTYKIIEKDDKMYIFKEYDEQITLKTILTKFKNSSVDERDVLNLAIQLIHCLNYMESQSLTNRDLNPANILFNKEKVYKIFDFGSSKIIEDDNKQILQSMAVGFNEFFMSPQMLGIDDQEINYYKSDIWSLGMILYYFGENQYPWRKDIQNNNLDEEIEKMKDRPLVFQRIKNTQLQNLIRKMLTYEQDKRPYAKQLIEDKYIQSQLAQQNPQEAKLELLSGVVQKLNGMRKKYELDETYEELIFNLIIRFFTENKKFINKGSQIYQSYHNLLDYQMFNKKELWLNFKIQYNTKRQLMNYVYEYKRQLKLNSYQQQELLLLLQTIDCQKTFPDNTQQLIEIVEKQYLVD
ncbi:unnamed protein product [Paramecium pentaurelia]|uniref:Protein kinase domain-containing protein n=1 Tax=Paramecium pentaurelia TaxID=43138 RepID=A0A8S1VSW9_9CILI|nr:unnamed protein product [Paramecium pentaurelia]